MSSQAAAESVKSVESTTTSPVEAPKPAAAKASKPKASKKGKKTMKKSTKVKASKNGDAEGLTKPQVRILRAVVKLAPHDGKNSLNRARISEKANVAATWVSGFTWKACAANKGPSLAERGLVSVIEVDVDGRVEKTVRATAAGRRMLAKIDGK